MQPWVVLPQGCTPNDRASCEEARGGLFRQNESSTWQSQGLYTLGFEQNLDIQANGDFGLDTITLGIPGSNAPVLESQVVAGIAAKDFYVATWGIRPAPTNLTDIGNPIPSLMQVLKEQSTIHSLSWGYTAGAYYQSQGLCAECQSVDMC